MWKHDQPLLASSSNNDGTLDALVLLPSNHDCAAGRSSKRANALTVCNRRTKSIEAPQIQNIIERTQTHNRVRR
eukprot:COSAG02_NODE_3922_length_6041_cov_11.166274_2_plen_74_part_00